MTQQNLVRIYPNIRAAEAAVKRLKDKKFPSDQISIVTQNTQTTKRHGFMNAAEVAAAKGVLTGGLLGLLVGAAFISTAGFAPLFAAGPFAVSLLGTLKGMVAGAAAGGLFSALLGLGSSKEQTINDDEDGVKDGGYMVFVHGDESLLSDARILLGDLSDYRGYPVDAEKILRFLN